MSSSKAAVHQRWPGLIEAYRDRLPVGDDWVPVTLFEGGTTQLPGVAFNSVMTPISEAAAPPVGPYEARATARNCRSLLKQRSMRLRKA